MPVTATGVRSRTVASRVLGTTFTQALSAAIMRLDVSKRHDPCFSLKVSAWLWQRIAPTRTQKPSTGTAGAAEAVALAEDLVRLGHALPLFACDMPLPRSLSIQGINEPPSGTPEVGGLVGGQCALALR